MHDLIQQRREELNGLCRRHALKRFELFGSAARSGADADDFDFLVESQTQSPSSHARAYFGLLADLEDLLGRPVDLVESPAAINPYFLRAISADRRVLYDA